jgi:glyoxylase-like metal-dependent hydrolase (beta-lactamase superfamily II)
MAALEDELGDVVRKARTGLGLDLSTLSQRVAISEQDLRGLEVYTHVPDESQVRRLADALQLRPDPLVWLAKGAWDPPEPSWRVGATYGIERITTSFPEHCYVVSSTAGECIVVDPGDEADRILATATREGRRVSGIFITHGHHDHIGAVVPLQRVTAVPVYVGAADAKSVDTVGAALCPLERDSRVEVGSFDVRVLHTPGHTAGGCTFVLEAGGETAAFCGDTLFAGSAGNSRHSYPALLHSLREKLAKLPATTFLYPGHGPATTIANEVARNPFL